MNSSRPLNHRRHPHAGHPVLGGIGLALGLALFSASQADASTYRVYTATAANSMTLNPNDGVCTLAEAVEHAKGNAVYNCTDFAPGTTEQRIELLASPNLPLSTTRFKITTLTLSRQGVLIRIFGSGGFIDTVCPTSPCATSAFIIPYKSKAFFERVTLTNTLGSAGGRLVENYGELGFYGVTFTKGDVTGSQHLTGRGGAIFNGNTQGFAQGAITSAANSVITGNKARKGGGIYNDWGKITQLAVTISNNSATVAGGGLYNHDGHITGSFLTVSGNTAPAGGGIYNFSTETGQATPEKGTIKMSAVTIQNNSARAGGGLFNRALVELLDGSSITGNFITSSGNSNEECTYAASNNTLPGVYASCNGSGGGVLNVHLKNASVTRFQLSNSVLSNNNATAKGGAIFSVGVLEMGGNTIHNNRAADGAMVYAVSPPDGTQNYCNFYGGNGTDHNTFVLTCNRTLTSGVGHSIVAGGSQSMQKCILNSTFMSSGGNPSPRCQPNAFYTDNFGCPAQNPSTMCPP